MTKQTASASVEVATDPETAFRIFTDDIDLWWVRGPINFFDSARAVGMKVEPGLGGRILEVYQRDPEDVLVLGRITVWEPGTRFAYSSEVDDTETRIDFESFGTGTRVTVEQTLNPGGKTAFYFWPNVIHWFPAWVARRDSAPGEPRELDRLSIALYYEDPAAAARWLHTVFGLDSWDKIPDEGEQPDWLELQVGRRAILLFKGEVAEKQDHGIWVYVDDLDAHFARSSAYGAKIVSEIRQHGYRKYEVDDLGGHRWTFAQARPTMA